SSHEGILLGRCDLLGQLAQAVDRGGVMERTLGVPIGVVICTGLAALAIPTASGIAVVAGTTASPPIKRGLYQQCGGNGSCQITAITSNDGKRFASFGGSIPNSCPLYSIVFKFTGMKIVAGKFSFAGTHRTSDSQGALASVQIVLKGQFSTPRKLTGTYTLSTADGDCAATPSLTKPFVAWFVHLV